MGYGKRKEDEGKKRRGKEKEMGEGAKERGERQELRGRGKR